MSTLAHVLEAAGLSTIVLGSNLSVVERMKPPRVLHCEFPLGRPLGKPGDAGYQRDVLERAFGLLDASEPVLEIHPDVIEADETPMACALPPRHDPNLPAAVDEAMGIRAAYDRAVAKRGATSVGRTISADRIVEALGGLHQWAQGAPWKETPLPDRNVIGVCLDIRTYYEEAALELADGPPPDGRATEAWFYESTQAGKTLMAARAAIKEQEAPFPLWFYMSPAHR